MIHRVSPLVGEQNKWGCSLWEGKPVSTWIPGTEGQGPHWPKTKGYLSRTSPEMKSRFNQEFRPPCNITVIRQGQG